MFSQASSRRWAGSRLPRAGGQGEGLCPGSSAGSAGSPAETGSRAARAGQAAGAAQAARAGEAAQTGQATRQAARAGQAGRARQAERAAQGSLRRPGRALIHHPVQRRGWDAAKLPFLPPPFPLSEQAPSPSSPLHCSFSLPKQ